MNERLRTQGDPKAGELRFAADELCFDPFRGTGWRIKAADLAVIGELSSPGECFDDHQLVLVQWDKSMTCAPLNAVGAFDALAQLGIALGANLDPSLLNVTEWSSRVMWPVELASAPMMVRVNADLGRAARRLTRSLGLSFEVSQMSPQVTGYIEERRPRSF